MWINLKGWRQVVGKIIEWWYENVRYLRPYIVWKSTYSYRIPRHNWIKIQIHTNTKGCILISTKEIKLTTSQSSFVKENVFFWTLTASALFNFVNNLGYSLNIILCVTFIYILYLLFDKIKNSNIMRYLSKKKIDDT